MTALADAGTGNYYFVRGGADLASVFAREFDAARTTVASALAVDIAPADGIRVVDAGGYPLEQMGTGSRFRPGALFPARASRLGTLAVPQAPRVSTTWRVTLGDAGGRPTTLALDRLPRVPPSPAGTISTPTSTRKRGHDRWWSTPTTRCRRELDGSAKDEAGAMNARVKAPAVAARMDSTDRLERDVMSAFEGAPAAQAAKQNELSKTKSAEAVDSRRVGAKK
jgi:Ca-activated chloride channel family protein